MICPAVQPTPVTLAQALARPALNLSALATHAIHVDQMQVMHMVVGINLARH